MTKALLASLLLAGCAAAPQASYVWRHDSGVSDQRQFDRDHGACSAQALAHPLMPVEQGAHLFAGCMAGRGWRLTQR